MLYARKRPADAPLPGQLPVHIPRPVPVSSIPRDEVPWFEIVKIVLPGFAKNKMFVLNVKEHINSHKKNPVADSLFMKSLITALESKIATKKDELTDYLRTQSIDTLVNSAMNTSPKIMETLCMVCDWEFVRERFIYVQMYPKATEIHFGRREMLLTLNKGRDNCDNILEIVAVFCKLFIKARVSCIYVRTYGPKENKKDVDGNKKKVEKATLRRENRFLEACTNHFTPIEGQGRDAERAEREDGQFWCVQTRDKATMRENNWHSERFLLYDRPREYQYLW